MLVIIERGALSNFDFNIYVLIVIQVDSIVLILMVKLHFSQPQYTQQKIYINDSLNNEKNPARKVLLVLM